MGFALGVDGGNSKTHAVILDEHGRVLGFGQGGCGNHQRYGLKSAITEINHAVSAAMGAAQLAPEQIEHACYCLAGADLEEDFLLLNTALRELHQARSFSLKNDTFAALRAGLDGNWGLVVVCGSGINAAIRTDEGVEFALPGLGAISGDWGGGSALGKEMIRLVMRAWDSRGEKTLLTTLVLRYFDAPNEENLMKRLYRKEISQSEILKLTPLLFRAADAGDQVAIGLVKKLADEVAITALALIRRMKLGSKPIEVVLGGSVFKGEGDLLVGTVKETIHKAAPLALVKRTRFEPVVGAGLLALENTGVVVGESLLGAIERSPVVANFAKNMIESAQNS